MVQFIDSSTDPKKRIFIFFMVCNWLSFVGTTYLLWWIGYPGLYLLHPRLPYLVGWIFVLGHSFFAFGFALIFLSIITGRRDLLSQRMRKLVLKLFLPVTIHAPFTYLGRKLLNISKSDIQRSFIELNNHFIQVKSFGLGPKQILVLLPQCIQNSECQVRITRNIHNCRLCGKCPVHVILKACQRYGVEACVATGGTLARKIIVEQKPQAVVAVACERELVSGIQDCYPIPVYGILNQRPHGHCTDTWADIDKVEKALDHLLSAKGSSWVKFLAAIKSRA